MVPTKPRGAVLCGRPCQGDGSVCDDLYGAGHGLRSSVPWSAQFLDFSFSRSAWVFLVRLKMLFVCLFVFNECRIEEQF